MSPTAPAPTAAALSPLELLYPDFAGEHISTRRLLERFPEGKGDWRPHERSRTLAELATHVADIPNRGVAIVTTDELDLASRQPLVPLTTAAEIVALHDASTEQLQQVLAKADLAALSGDWVVRRGPQVVIRAPRRTLLRVVMMSHLIHHRAQLGVYLRLLGVAIPGMYGPSADEATPRSPV